MLVMTPRQPRDRRRWTTTLAADIPPGPDGQPAHEAGAEVTVITAVNLLGVGGVSFAVPRPSTLLLEAAEQHLRVAARLRAQAVKQVRRVRWIQPGMEWSFANEQLVMDFFREAIAGIICAFAALDNLANELLPWDFAYTDPDVGQTRTREDLERNSGIELRLSRVAALATGRTNLRTADPELWRRLTQLKVLRDDLVHAKANQALPADDVYGSIFARVFNALDVDARSIVDDVRAAADHYLGRP